MGILDLFTRSDAAPKRTEDQERNFAFLSRLTTLFPHPVLVVDSGSKELLFANAAGTALLDNDATLPTRLAYDMDNGGKDERTMACVSDDHPVAHTASRHRIRWGETAATAYILVPSAGAEDPDASALINTDSLTGFFNKTHAIITLEQRVAAGQPFGFCILSIDNLNHVNNLYGRDHGDQYIAITAAAIADAFPDAVRCRAYGGEFFVIAGDCGEADCLRRADALRERLGALLEGVPYYCSLSCGAVDFAADRGYNTSSLLEIANERLQKQKLDNHQNSANIVIG